MEVNREIVYSSPGYSFCFQATRDRKIHYNWHAHAEYELAACRQGYGEIHIGEFIHSFKNPAVFFIAPNTAHTLVSSGNFDGWIIQIPPLVLNSYEGRPEFAFLTALVKKTSPALRFSEKASAEIIRRLERAQEESGVFRWLWLVEMFFAASNDSGARLCSFSPEVSGKAGDKMDEVINYVFNNYTKSHRLNDLALRSGMPVQRFCRNFKKKTGMTLSGYILSVRINTVKKLLQQSRMYVDDICYEAGFNSVSFFNRQFKEHTGMTPMEYRRRFGLAAERQAPAMPGGT
ncbi:MAG: AraC family transcriptional regulator [Treponema sp.]|nr:AraC family transcriptional regulator [Treponema sp.]